METIIKWIVAAVLDWLVKFAGKERVAAEVEKKFEDELNQKVSAAVSELRAAYSDPNKTVEERERDAEAAFDRFRNRLS